MENMTTLRRVVTASIVLVVIVHILAVCAFTFFPESFSAPKSNPGRLYTYFIHLGPFYREESIRSSPHVVISSGKGEVDLITGYHTQYLQRPWRINRLLLRDYVRRGGDKLTSAKHRDRAMRSILRLQDISVEGESDSIKIHYFHRRYDLIARRGINDTIVSVSNLPQ